MNSNIPLQIITDCFAESPINIGIDKIELQFSAKIDIHKEKLRMAKNQYPKNIYISKEYEAIGTLSLAEIKSEDFGKFKMRQQQESESLYNCTLSIIFTGLNIPTSSIDQIRGRTHTILNILHNNYGILIHLDINNVRIKKIEIAFTYATTKRIPLYTRMILFRSISGIEQPGIKTFYNDNEKDYHCIFGKEDSNFSIVLYDKLAKAEKDGYFPKNTEHGFRVYRLEFTLKNNRVKKELGTNLLNYLDEKHLTNFLENIILEGKDRFLNILEKSIQDTDESLAKCFSQYRSNRYIEMYFMSLIKEPMEKLQFTIIDEEIFCYLKLSYLIDSTNKARTKKNLIQQCHEQHNLETYPLSTMSSWVIWVLYKFMWNALEDIQSGKLKMGKQSTLNASSMQMISIKQYSNETRKNELFNIINKITKKTTITANFESRWESINLSKLIECR